MRQIQRTARAVGQCLCKLRDALRNDRLELLQASRAERSCPGLAAAGMFSRVSQHEQRGHLGLEGAPINV